jgi:large subunit ribosomal protein L4
MKVDVLDLKGEKIREMELPANIFEAPVNIDLMHQAYTRQMANARLGTHQTKVRGEVRGGGRKPFKQKGTGRARQDRLMRRNGSAGVVFIHRIPVVMNSVCQRKCARPPCDPHYL